MLKNRHKFIFATVLILTSAGFAYHASAADHAGQAKYLPRQVSNLHLGMPFREFKTIRNVPPTEENAENNDLFDFRTELTESLQDNEVKAVTYYFAKDGDEPLYEIILEYHGGFDVRGYAVSRFGAPNYKDEWRFDSGEGFGIMLWVFNNKLIIAGAIKGTAWEKGKA